MSKRSGIVIVAGPTASGKSALALALARQFAGTIINADALQVYRELRILTARPTRDDEAQAPHRLYGILPAAEICSAARWRGMALDAIDDAEGDGRLPILVGGTGLYLRALLQGLAPVPAIPEAVRGRARRLVDRFGAARLHRALAARSPELTAGLRPNDPQRVARAYEVLAATGAPLSHWQAQAAPGFAGPVATIVLDPPRPDLYARCDARFAAMLAAGALDEVHALMAQGLPPDRPALKAVGVPELAAHVRGELALPEAVKAAQQATRRYAKRQSTWFRHQLSSNFVIKDPLWEQESLISERKIFPFIREFLLTVHT